jgi:biopolymer transport protein ExbD
MGAKIGGPGGESRYNIESNSEINVTPFVDVMLVLLIIFMVSAPLATVSIKLDMPPAVPRNTQEKPDPPTFISLQNNGEIFIGKGEEATVPTTLETLGADLAGRGLRPSPSEDRVFVRAQSEVTYDQFMAALNNLQDNGFYTIGLINEDIS